MLIKNNYNLIEINDTFEVDYITQIQNNAYIIGGTADYKIAFWNLNQIDSSKILYPDIIYQLNSKQ